LLFWEEGEVSDNEAIDTILPDPMDERQWTIGANDLTPRIVMDPSFGVSFAFQSNDDAADSHQMHIDFVALGLTFTTPPRRPGRLKFAYTNTGSPQNIQCVIEPFALNPDDGLKTGIEVESGNWDFTDYSVEHLESASRPDCEVCECDETGGGSGTVCENCAGNVGVHEVYIDFGTLSLTGSHCALSELAPTYVLEADINGFTLTPGSWCTWVYTEVIECPEWAMLILRLLHNSNQWGLVVSLLTVNEFDPNEAVLAIYISEEDLDCVTFPVTLTKYSETGGGWPDEITLDEP
jgi:hypothetical protein